MFRGATFPVGATIRNNGAGDAGAVQGPVPARDRRVGRRPRSGPGRCHASPGSGSRHGAGRAADRHAALPHAGRLRGRLRTPPGSWSQVDPDRSDRPVEHGQRHARRTRVQLKRADADGQTNVPILAGRTTTTTSGPATARPPPRPPWRPEPVELRDHDRGGRRRIRSRDPRPPRPRPQQPPPRPQPKVGPSQGRRHEKAAAGRPPSPPRPRPAGRGRVAAAARKAAASRRPRRVPSRRRAYDPGRTATEKPTSAGRPRTLKCRLTSPLGLSPRRVLRWRSARLRRVALSTGHLTSH